MVAMLMFASSCNLLKSLVFSVCTWIYILFCEHAGIAKFYICKSIWTWHAWDNLGGSPRHYSGEDFWWQWKENFSLRVPADNAAGMANDPLFPTKPMMAKQIEAL